MFRYSISIYKSLASCSIFTIFVLLIRVVLLLFVFLGIDNTVHNALGITSINIQVQILDNILQVVCGDNVHQCLILLLCIIILLLLLTCIIIIGIPIQLL